MVVPEPDEPDDDVLVALDGIAIAVRELQKI